MGDVKMWLRRLRQVGLVIVSGLIGLQLGGLVATETRDVAAYFKVKSARVQVRATLAKSSAKRSQSRLVRPGQLYRGTLPVSSRHTTYRYLKALTGQPRGWVKQSDLQPVQPALVAGYLKRWGTQKRNGHLALIQPDRPVTVTLAGPPGTTKTAVTQRVAAKKLTEPAVQVIGTTQTSVGQYYLLQVNQHPYGWVAAQPFVYQAAAVTPIKAKTWRRIDQLIATQPIQGTLLVAKKGQTIPTVRDYGTTGRPTATLDKPTTIYPIASLQKAMTGVMIGQLIQSHQLTLTTTLAKFYPQVPYAKQITIQQLLDHTSGIVMNEVAPARPLSEVAAVQWALKHLTSTNQHRWQYCSANYTLLAGVIRQVTKKTYAENLQQRILKPAGMTQTAPWSQFAHQKIALPYVATARATTPAHRISLPLLSSELGAGDIGTTVMDYYRFVAAFNDGTLLSAHMRTQLTRIRAKTYAAGWYYGAGGGQHASGYDNDISNFYQRTAAGGVTVVFFMNQANHQLAQQLVQQIATLIAAD
ncbi:hypothetical protein C5Z25_10800 [Lactobacillus sp. CBA3605]|nr:hypothetical protein C5Z25_10800 [Lactobacillus sp. CBA3605]